ncbi:MAG: PCRF domain-containing protein, partial [Patescibacteria group bacterium]
MAQPDFWADPTRAKEQSRRLDELRTEIEQWDTITSAVTEMQELAQEADTSGDHTLKPDIEQRCTELERQFSSLEFYMLLSGKYDERSAIVAIHAGTGGVDAQDWAAILLRMYLRFAERKGWVVRVVDESVGAEAGIKSVTFEVTGRYAYGFL